jgi:type II secretory pathway component PulF
MGDSANIPNIPIDGTRPSPYDGYDNRKRVEATIGGGPLSKSDSGQSGSPVTLDQLIALNDEMAALVRAGVPLERGLIRAGSDLRGRLGAIVRDLGDRMGQGDRLPEALTRSGYAIPDLYRAIIEAGLRSGRLASALEGMATVSRGYADARRAVGLALLYPLMVVMVAYGLGLAFILILAPRLAEAFHSLGLRPMGFLEALARSGDTAIYWGPIVPIVLLLLAARWVWSGRSMAMDSGPFGSWTTRIPLVGAMIAGFRNANFADLLALMIEHQVPLDEAVRLAAEASGGGTLRQSAEALSERLRRGERADSGGSAGLGTLPPLLTWMLTAGHRQGDLASALRHAATTYRRRAEARADLIRAALPTTLMLVIGAGTVLLYGFLLFVPMTTLYDELSLPTN